MVPPCPCRCFARSRVCAPLPLSLECAVFEQHGLKIHNFYGTTECGGIAVDASATPRTEDLA